MEDNEVASKTLSTGEFKKSIPSYVLDDLSSRFIINSRPEEIKDIIRILFQIEIAHWFYLDFHRVENPSLKDCDMKEFSFNYISLAAKVINHCPLLKKYAPDFNKHYENWKQYKRTIETYGAIILDKDLKHVLLVQSYVSKTSWGFPKGKINQNETPVNCAVREVFEETGFDIGPYIDPAEYLERNINEQLNRLYLIKGVPLDSTFQPKTRREIRDIQWFPMDTLPTHKGDSTLKETVGQNLNLYTVTPYLRALRKWISEKQNPEPSSKQRNRQKQQKLFAHQNQSQFHEYMQLKKGKLTPKNFVNQRKSSVRYSGDMADFHGKQGRRGMTVVQSLFGHREPVPPPTFKAPVVDTNSFYSQALYNFKVDTEGLLALLPQPGNICFPRQ